MSAGIVIGFSGPDGAGKTSLASGVARALVERDLRVERVYLYGCFVCRRISPNVAAAGSSPGLPAPAARAHGLLDAAELAVRLESAVRRLRRRSEPNALVTDRTPLDGLAKHAVVAGDSLRGRLFARSAARYDAVFVLDAPPDVLARRDREHSGRQIAAMRRRFADARALVPRAVMLDATRNLDELVTDVLREIAGWSKSPL